MPTRSSTPPTTRASATSTRPAPTAARRSSSAPGCAAAGSRPARSRSARSGATPTPPTGRSTPTRPRSRTCRSTPSGASSTRRASSWASTSRSTRSTRRRSTAACWTTRRARRARRAARAEACGSACRRAGPSRAKTVERAIETGGLRHGSGDLERARALRRPGPRARPRGRHGGDRQGGGRERAPDLPRRHRRVSTRSRAGSGRPPMPWRLPPCWRSRGSTSS